MGQECFTRIRAGLGCIAGDEVLEVGRLPRDQRVPACLFTSGHWLSGGRYEHGCFVVETLALHQNVLYLTHTPPLLVRRPLKAPFVVTALLLRLVHVAPSRLILH